MAGGVVRPAPEAGAQKVAVLLPLAQGQSMAQLGEADGLANKTLALLALSVGLLTAVGAYWLADVHQNWWYVPVAGLGASAILFFRALLPGPSPEAESVHGSGRTGSAQRVRARDSHFRQWSHNRLDIGQPPDVLYEGIRALSELEAYRCVLGTL